MYKYAEMQKLAAEQRVIVEAMTKIANANGYYLTPQVAQQIAYQHMYSPVLIMKTASMTPEELRMLAARASSYPEAFFTGQFPGIGPLIQRAISRAPGSMLSNTMLPNLLGAGLGAGIGFGGASLLGADPFLPTGMGTAIGGSLGSLYGTYRGNRV